VVKVKLDRDLERKEVKKVKRERGKRTNKCRDSRNGDKKRASSYSSLGWVNTRSYRRRGAMSAPNDTCHIQCDLSGVDFPFHK
jgi:hypothetical protein